MSLAALWWQILGKIVMPLSAMGHQNGQERAVWASLREQTSPNSQTARCAVRRTISSTHKNAVQNAMAPYASCTLLAFVIAVRVHCVCSVRAHGNETKRARRVSAVLWPIEGPSLPPELVSPPLPATKPILWGDWSRCQTRRRLMNLLRTQTVTITLTPGIAPTRDTAHRGPFTKEERKHYRLTWEQRLACNASSASGPRVKLHLFGIPSAFAQSIGLLSLA
jgi:hypothetical protein